MSNLYLNDLDGLYTFVRALLDDLAAGLRKYVTLLPRSASIDIDFIVLNVQIWQSILC